MDLSKLEIISYEDDMYSLPDEDFSKLLGLIERLLWYTIESDCESNIIEEAIELLREYGIDYIHEK